MKQEEINKTIEQEIADINNKLIELDEEKVAMPPEIAGKDR